MINIKKEYRTTNFVNVRFIMNSHVFLITLAYFNIITVLFHGGQLDFNAAQNVQAIYNLNFLHRENADFFIYVYIISNVRMRSNGPHHIIQY